MHAVLLNVTEINVTYIVHWVYLFECNQLLCIYEEGNILQTIYYNYISI